MKKGLVVHTIGPHTKIHFIPDASLIDPNEMEFDAFEMWENVSEDTEVDSN